MKCFFCKTEIEEDATTCPDCGNDLTPDKKVDIDEKELMKFWERFNRIICADDEQARKYDEVANPGTWQLIIDMSETIVKQLTNKYPVLQYSVEPDQSEQLKGIFFCGLRAGYFINLIDRRRENEPVPFHERNLELEEIKEKLFGVVFNEEAYWRIGIKPLIKEIITLFNDLMIAELDRLFGKETEFPDDLKNEINSLLFSSIVNGFKVAEIEEELLSKN